MSTCQLTMKEVADIVQGRLFGPDKCADMVFTGVSTDSRSLQATQLFVALTGPHFNGCDFMLDAVSRGAAALLLPELQLDRPEQKASQKETLRKKALRQKVLRQIVPQIIVSDTQTALMQLAAAWRQRFTIPLVAVTGSNGKTTVKEMLAAIFAQTGTVHATRGNLNNEIGVPLTLLELNEHHTAAIIEQGASRSGDIAYLTKITRPTVALVTNAGDAHLEGFGDLDTVARTKGEIFEHLPADGIAVINADDPYAAQWRAQSGDATVIHFGLNTWDGGKPDVWGQWQIDSPLKIHTSNGEFSVQLALAGRHNAINALAATAVALAVGFSLVDIKRGLESLQVIPGRLQWKASVNGVRLLDDTYNANPASLASSLAVLAACPGDLYLVLGDMAELGDAAISLHQAAGRQARAAGVQRLYATGEYSRHAVTAFGDQAWHFADQADMVERLREDLTPDTTLLVKGSRSAHMEWVVDALLAANTGGTG
ncbi:MAG: UDP-N-acetylmuramoyl-tripeptide--D-alanyl-D-alanine ligase [Gammaproteobacteria bacterium]|nr:UDP-N-acetylmuramoyl-tripeptide--D-alanyl-D-alanine ligase [Gammaproteobacteria bacterium]